ncbi:MAG: serine hydrolase domain-containing protein [Thermoanaerobaculia bacterium]
MKRSAIGLLFVFAATVFGVAYTKTAVGPNPRVTLPSAADDNLPQQLGSHFSELEQRHQFTGYVLVATQGSVVFERGDGSTDLSTQKEPTAQTQFQIGSLTKQFVVAAILVLVDQGKLDLSVKIGSYMPNLAEPARDLTIHQLLSNTSGIATAPFAEGATQQLLGPATRADLLATFVGEPLRFEPGSKFEYSNSGFLLLGALIEQITGRSAESFFAEHLFEKAEMTGSFLPEQGDFQQIRNQHTGGDFAVGYRRMPSGTLEPHQEAFDMSVIFTAGAMVSTAQDLFLWTEALYSGKLFSPQLVDKMTTANLNHYCYGIYERILTNGMVAYSHSGGIFGFHSYLLVAPDNQTTVVILSNDENQYIGRFGEELAVIAAGQTVPLPTATTPTPRDLAQFAGTYIGQYLGNPIEFTLKAERHQLHLVRPNGSKTPLFAEDENRFYAQASRATYTFIRTDKDTITALNIEVDGIPIMQLPKESQ